MRVLAQQSLNRRQTVRAQEMTPLNKADMVLTDLTGGGGYLTAENSREFIIVMIKEAKLIQDMLVLGMKSHTRNLDKTRFTGDVLQVAGEATELPLADRSEPDMTRSVITAKAFKAEVRLNDFVLEDQIEGPNFAATVQATLAKAIGRDMEDIIIRSDTTGSLALKYKQMDGLFKLASTNVLDATDTILNKGILRDMTKLMPQEFLDRSKVMFYTSVDADIDYRDAYANRQTLDGDSYLAEYKPVYYNGIPIKAIQLFPENIGTSSHCTDVMLMDPKNFALGIYRKLKMEHDKNIRAGVISIVASIRFGVNFVEETAVVKATNVKVV